MVERRTQNTRRLSFSSLEWMACLISAAVERLSWLAPVVDKNLVLRVWKRAIISNVPDEEN